MPKLTDEIKVRVDPLRKLQLQQVAEEEERELSDIVRRALGDFLDKRAATQRNQESNAYARP
jgi:predicted transcriptional regulator